MGAYGKVRYGRKVTVRLGTVRVRYGRRPIRRGTDENGTEQVRYGTGAVRYGCGTGAVRVRYGMVWLGTVRYGMGVPNTIMKHFLRAFYKDITLFEKKINIIDSKRTLLYFGQYIDSLIYSL